MIRFKPLPQIALTNLQPAFYDVESATAVEMVAKLYSYLQNLVNDYNAFVTEINNEINAFEDDINYKIDDFTKCVKQLMNDYIQSIDMKISLQDKTIDDAIQRQDNIIADAIQRQDNIIADAVKYMKENIIQTTETIINQAIANGDIQVSIEYNESTEALNIIVTGKGE